jgi:hypothetical protein
MKKDIRFSTINHYLQAAKDCYICKGQRSGNTEYRLQYVDSDDPDCYTEKFFHGQCLGENLAYLITEDEKFDAHVEAEQNRKG